MPVCEALKQPVGSLARMAGCSSSLLAPCCFYDFNCPRAVDRRPGGVLLLFPVAHLLNRRDIELPPKILAQP